MTESNSNFAESLRQALEARAAARKGAEDRLAELDAERAEIRALLGKTRPRKVKAVKAPKASKAVAG